MDKIEQIARALRAAEICRERGITQTQIADAIGASQPQVSRILQGKGQGHARLFEEVCLYVERLDHGVTDEAVKANQELISAIRETWDGSTFHAKALATIIRSLNVLSPYKEHFHAK
jgi:predicted transcriptional regulator